MKTRVELVVELPDTFFDEDVDNAIEELESNSCTIVDIKFAMASDADGHTHHSALIVYTIE